MLAPVHHQAGVHQHRAADQGGFVQAVQQQHGPARHRQADGHQAVGVGQQRGAVQNHSRPAVISKTGKVALRCMAGSAHVVLHQALFFPLPLAVFLGFALVMLFLPLARPISSLTQPLR